MPSLTKFCIPLLFLCSVIACQEPESKQSLASGQIGQHQLDSEILGRTVDYQIYQPSGESEGIIYLLHGHGGDHNDWFESGEGHVSTIMDSLISNDVIPPMHAVSADMGNSWYVNRSYPAQDFYLDEFMAHIETSYLDDQVKIRLLAGNSAGGYGSLRFSLIEPSLFDGVILLSPASYTPLPPDISSSRKVEAFAIEGVFNDSIWDSFSYLHLIDQLEPGSDMPQYFVSTGDDDAYNIVPAVTRIQQELIGREIACELRVTNGGHDWACWKENFANALSLFFDQ